MTGLPSRNAALKLDACTKTVDTVHSCSIPAKTHAKCQRQDVDSTYQHIQSLAQVRIVQARDFAPLCVLAAKRLVLLHVRITGGAHGRADRAQTDRLCAT